MFPREPGNNHYNNDNNRYCSNKYYNNCQIVGPGCSQGNQVITTIIMIILATVAITTTTTARLWAQDVLKETR